MPTITNAEIAQQIGDVREKLGSLMEGQAHASQGRHTLHEKLDGILQAVQSQAVSIAELSKDAQVATATAAQTRDRFDAFDREFTPIVTALSSEVADLQKTHNDEIVPAVSTVKQIRNLAAFFAGIAALGVISVGGILTFFNEFARSAFLQWLGLA